MTPRRATRTILHVDDDPLVRRAIARTLAAAGFSVTSAAAGPQGLIEARRLVPDLVILDVDLPGLSGFDVCARLRADRTTRRIPILHLSAARVDLDDRIEGLERGADAYLVQPVEPEELVAVVRAMLARRRRGDGSRPATLHASHAAAARRDALTLTMQLLAGPLSAIGISASGLRASSLGDDPVARSRASAVADAHAAATRLLSELVELAHLESSRGPLPLEATAPAQIAAAAAASVQRVAAQRGVEICVEAPEDAFIRCDGPRLTQALAALLAAAIRAAPPHHHVRVGAIREESLVRFSIAWDGPPLRDEERALIEEGLWSTRRRRNAPAALELALAHAVVEAHYGRLWCDENGRAVHVAITAVPVSAS